MTPAEFKSLPYGFIKKYGSIVDLMRIQQEELHKDQNLQYNNYYKQV